MAAGEVHIEALQKTIQFEQNELIATELSKKYDTKQIDHIAEANGFKPLDHFMDCRHYFVDSLLEK